MFTVSQSVAELIRSSARCKIQEMTIFTFKCALKLCKFMKDKINQDSIIGLQSLLNNV